MKQKLIDSEIACPKATMASVEANKQRWDQETAHKIEEVLAQADVRMQKANAEWDARLKKANEEVKMLEAQVNGFATNFEESAVQVQSLSVQASSKINKLAEGLDAETSKAADAGKKTKKHAEKIDRLVKEIDVQKKEIEALSKKALQAGTKATETQTKLDA